jgi:hypothetical protein
VAGGNWKELPRSNDCKKLLNRSQNFHDTCETPVHHDDFLTRHGIFVVRKK